MDDLSPGLYEWLITVGLAANLTSRQGLPPELRPLRNAEAADRLALHIASIVEQAIESLPEKERAAAGVRIARHLVERASAAAKLPTLLEQSPTESAEILQSIPRRAPDGGAIAIEPPLIPLLDTTLLTNSPGEPRVGQQLISEIESADRVDLVMAFIRRSGILPLREKLRRFIESGRSVRVLTTVYTGSTELQALKLLESIGAKIRISYDTTGTRLHAKAWLFHRESGYSTAYVGSSNLTHSAQVSGLEWNVRISGKRNRSVIDKISAVFESYWEQPDFEPFEAERFIEATKSERPNAAITLSPIEIRLEPFQERLLEQIEVARARGHHRNLLVSATGTGKTVMAAVFYARLRSSLPRARLLFVAHRAEILEQSRATFAHALRDAGFGEMWVGGQRPSEFEHVFASIQSLAANGPESLDPSHFDVVIVDEFHHAAAPTYARLLDHVKPRELLGLTATPERADGESILKWFDGRLAAELRLWDAIDQHRLTPFSYFGIADDLDLREIPWRRGSGYDVDGLTNLMTANDAWARRVLHEFYEHVGDLKSARALGFCVSVTHARYMARVFCENGVRAEAVWSDTEETERQRVLRDLRDGRTNVVFSVDLFNEGVDVPSVDSLLMLRPTDSPTLFLQQLGRGLRKSKGKSVCTVLDFVGQHRREFRFDRRFQALLGGSRSSLEREIDRGFPFLPAGCHMELDRVAKERVLNSIRNAIPRSWSAKIQELRQLTAERGDVSLRQFLELSGLELDDVYDGRRCWSDLRRAAGLSPADSGPDEVKLSAACGRLLHVNDAERLATWSRWLAMSEPPSPATLTVRERRLLLMLLVQLFDQIADQETTLETALASLWSHPQVLHALRELFDMLLTRVDHNTIGLSSHPDVPLNVQARYTRQEILSGSGVNERVKPLTWREGVRYASDIKTDLFVFTLDKTDGDFSPTTRYRDYAISRELVHWESQSGTHAESPTGTRYRTHAAEGGDVFLFARLTSEDRAFHFIGPATYVSHTGNYPMAIVWKLQHPLPGDLFQSFAAAVA
jgi:superfamily II DNA or RNA helicase